MIPESGAYDPPHSAHSGMLDLAFLGSLVIPGRPEEVSGVRTQIRSLLGDEHPAVEDIQLLISEAVTNAIKHTASGLSGGTVTVWIFVSDGVVRAEVIDDGGTGPPPRLFGDLWAENGRGLWLMAAIAARHGYVPGESEGRCWFEVEW